MTTRGIEIPGTFIATLDESGAIISYTFLPDEGSPGYFGPGSLDIDDGEPVDPDPDGPFWNAVTATLSAGRITVPVIWEG